MKPKSFWIAIFILTIILARLFHLSIETYQHKNSIQACHAPCANGDCDGYVEYAQWLRGKSVPWGETHTLRQSHNYNPYLTKIALAVPDNDLFFISAGGDDFIRFWSWDGTSAKGAIKSHQSGVTSLAWNPTTPIFASGGWDGTVKLYSKDGNLLYDFKTGQIAVTSLAFSGDGRTLVTGGWDGTLKIWTAQGKDKGLVLKGHEGAIAALAFSPDNKIIASASYDWTVRVWSQDGLALGTILTQPYWPFHGVSFTKEGTLLAAGDDTKLYSCTPPTYVEQKWKCLVLHKGYPYLNAVSRQDSKQILAGSNDYHAFLFNHDGTTVDLNGGQTNVSSAVAYSHDGSRAIVANQDGTIKVWNVDGTSALPLIKAHYQFKPGRGPLNIPDHPRQIGMPLLIAGYMGLVGVDNTCAVKVIQPLLLAFFIGLIFWFTLKSCGSLFSLGVLIPFLDTENYFFTYAQSDYTEFTLMIFLPLIVGLMCLFIFGKRNRWFAFGSASVLAFLLSQLKIMVLVFLLLFLAGIFVSVVWHRCKKQKPLFPVRFSQVSLRMALLGVLFVGSAIIDMKLYPESIRANERLTFLRYLPVPVKKTNDPQLERFGRFQSLAHRRWRRMNPDPSKKPEFDSINYELTIMNPTGDEHSLVDPESGEVFYFNELETRQIAYKIIKSNPSAFLKFGTEAFVSSWRYLFLFTPRVDDHGLDKFLWVSLLVLGLCAGFYNYSLLTLAGVMSLGFLYCYFSYMFIFNMRYWMVFSIFYYFIFALGFTTLVQRGLRLRFKGR